MAKPGFERRSARFQILFSFSSSARIWVSSLPVILKETLLLSSAYRTMTMFPPLVTDFFWFRLVTGVFLGTQVSLHGGGEVGGCQWIFTPILGPLGGQIPACRPHPEPSGIFRWSPRRLLRTTQALQEASVWVSDSGDLTSPRLSLCDVSTKARRGIKMHLIKITFQVQGTKSRQITGQGRLAPSFCKCLERAVFDTE